MIDTIVATLEHPNIRGILDNLQSYSLTDHGSHETIRGKYRNLNVEIEVSKSRNKLITLLGSLHKFYKGNNISQFAFSEVREAIEELEDELMAPIGKAELARIDIGANIRTKEKPYRYLVNLDYLPKYRKSIIRNYETVYFTAHNRELAFYDKIRESRLTMIHKNEHLLRYEYRFKNSICQQLSRNQITVDLLKEEKFQTELATRWKDEYMRIKRDSDVVFNGEPLIPNIRDFLTQNGIKSLGGLNRTLLLFEDSFSKYNKSSNHKSRVKSWLNKTYKSNAFLSTKHLRELDFKIVKRARRWPS